MNLRFEMEKCKSVKECKQLLTDWNNVYKNDRHSIQYDKIFRDILNVVKNRGVFSDWVSIGLNWFNNRHKLKKYNDQDWRNFLHHLWVNNEFNRDEFDIRKLISNEDKNIIEGLRMDDTKMYSKLSRKVKVYRGICLDKNDKLNTNDLGMSWSLDRNVGIWFSRRFYEFVNDCKCYLVKGYAKKEDIIMCNDLTSEKEVVIMGKVKVRQIENIDGKKYKGMEITNPYQHKKVG